MHLCVCIRKPFLTVHLPEGHAAMNVVRTRGQMKDPEGL